MTTILVAALITTLGFGGLVALRLGWGRARFALTAAVVIAAESLVLGILFIALTWERIDGTPWIDVPLRSLAQQAVGFGIASGVLGTCFYVITRILAVGHQVRAAALLGLLIPLGIGALIIGVRVAQDDTTATPFAKVTPFPTLTPVPTSSHIQVERAFLSLDFTGPTNLLQPDDESDRIFITEQKGRILVFPNHEQVDQATTFLDITDRVNSESQEAGLLGIVFDPAFQEKGYFYLYYTASNPLRTVLSRFSVSQNDANLADKHSELIIMEIAQPHSRHNGGQLGFGPDDYLYISVGDGGAQGDPDGHAQNKATLLGSILRIDVSAASNSEKYRIPSDNPFVGVAGTREEIWAYGLRNPWRWSFDQTTGLMWAADVGHVRWEEIDIIEKGSNYGWNIVEGRQCFSPPVGCDHRGLQLPVATYGRIDGCAIIGGFVYRGDQIPSLVGAYLYGDFCSGKIWGLWYDGNSIVDRQR